MTVCPSFCLPASLPASPSSCSVSFFLPLSARPTASSKPPVSPTPSPHLFDLTIVSCHESPFGSTLGTSAFAVAGKRPLSDVDTREQPKLLGTVALVMMPALPTAQCRRPSRRPSPPHSRRTIVSHRGRAVPTTSAQSRQRGRLSAGRGPMFPPCAWFAADLTACQAAWQV